MNNLVAVCWGQPWDCPKTKYPTIPYDVNRDCPKGCPLFVRSSYDCERCNDAER